MRKSFSNAYVGMSYCVRTQRNLRIHLAVTVLVLLLSAVLRVSLPELAVLVFCIMVVIVAEMLNTALECAVDLVTSDYHPLAKLSKDISAGAVLVASLGAAVVGAIIFLPRLWQLLTGGLAVYAPVVEVMGKLI
ncbi:diacylglycerol kinase family protein [Rubrobacter aplysinae]|uniref:diacylglycerol kinase family protein n=1 Tax=Rubrobacter aplysinae TaxID=909625 RepID=UPI0022860DC3|nr:diacylglycerol kinase family protein [Rubrobacter aplysinae]